MKKVGKLAAALVVMAAAIGMMGCAQPSGGNNAGGGTDGGTDTTPAKQTVATPTFSVESGLINVGSTVAISCTTEGAEIHFTTDGTEPTEESFTYGVAISVTTAMTIKAIAVKQGMNNSAVASVSYTIYVPKYAVGDFILKDGTRQSKDETPAADTVAAVIVRSDTPTSPALGVGIVYKSNEWSIIYTDKTYENIAKGYNTNIEALQGTVKDGYMDGSDSWEKLKAACSDAEDHPEYYPAFNYCLTYAAENNLTGALATGWYLPAMAELYTIWENKKVVDASLIKAGKAEFKTNNYWSCCQYSGKEISARNLNFNDGLMSYNGKSFSQNVCAVRAFN